MSDPISGSLALWAYIQNLYSQINTGRTNFNIGSTITIPSNPGSIQASTISTIVDYIEAFNANTYIANSSDAQVAINSISEPKTGELIKPLTLSTTLDTINGVCQYNASYRSSYNSSDNSTYRASYNSSYDSTYRAGYNSSDNSTYRASYRSSDNSTYRASYHSSNNSAYRAANRASYRASYRSSNNSTYRASYRSSNNSSYRASIKGTR